MSATNGTRAKKFDVARTILVVLSTIGLLSVALVAPNVIQLLAPPRGRKGRRLSPWEMERAIDNLIHKGFVHRTEQSDDDKIGITPRGRRYLKLTDWKNVKIKKPARWDGKWRLVFFDIPHSEKYLRDAVRRKLQELGFYQVQKSIYLHPYDCYGIIRGMQDFYKIHPHLQYAVVEKLEHAEKYERHFSLSR